MRRAKEPIPTLLLLVCVWIFAGKFPVPLSLSADAASATANGKQKAAPSPSLKPGQAVSSGTIEMHQTSASGTDVLDPMHRAWSSAPSSSIALQAQNVVTPYGGGSIKAVLVKSLRLPSGVAFRFEWKDDTRDNDTVHQTKFRDAVAIEFPLGTTNDTVLAMGSPHGPVDIWHWKADWEPDAPVMNERPYEKDVDSPSIGSARSLYRRLHVDSPQEANTAQGAGGPASGMYNLFPQSAHKSPVEDIVAIGISSVTTKPERFQTLKGRGIWREGSWHVAIYKPLPDKNDDTYPQFLSGSSMNTAIAIWNGASQDRNGMKSLSNWTTLKIR
jgi:hypothetical protein